MVNLGIEYLEFLYKYGFYLNIRHTIRPLNRALVSNKLKITLHDVYASLKF